MNGRTIFMIRISKENDFESVRANDVRLWHQLMW